MRRAESWYVAGFVTLLLAGCGSTEPGLELRLVGKWQMAADPKSVKEYRADGSVFKWSGGAATEKVGQWSKISQSGESLVIKTALPDGRAKESRLDFDGPDAFLTEVLPGIAAEYVRVK
jgi:hypothetical protein